MGRRTAGNREARREQGEGGWAGEAEPSFSGNGVRLGGNTDRQKELEAVRQGVGDENRSI